MIKANGLRPKILLTKLTRALRANMLLQSQALRASIRKLLMMILRVKRIRSLIQEKIVSKLQEK